MSVEVDSSPRSSQERYPLSPVSTQTKKPHKLLSSSPEVFTQYFKAKKRPTLELVPVIPGPPQQETFLILSSQEDPPPATPSLSPELFHGKRPRIETPKKTPPTKKSHSQEAQTVAIEPPIVIDSSPESIPSKRAPVPQEMHWEPSTAVLLEQLECKEGTLDYRQGTYVGALQELVPHGKGTWRSAKGGSYEGDWVDGKFHGRGTYHYANGNFYDGEWKEGLREGQGVFLFRNGDAYEGEWKQDCMHGQGTATYAINGNFYKGQWENNQRHGHGTFHYVCKKPYEDKFITFEGEYNHNLRHGTFTISTPQGSQCELDFQNDKPIKGSSRLIKLSVMSNQSGQYSLYKWFKKIPSITSGKQHETSFVHRNRTLNRNPPG